MKKNLEIRAKELRVKGYSIKELSEFLGVSKSTISIWVKNVILTKNAKIRLLEKSTKARLKSQATIKEKTRIKEEEAVNFSENIANSNFFSKESMICLCAMIWWCEGSKRETSLVFTNSDPNLIQSFLYLLRKSFDLDESKFRVLMHLHDYHNELELKSFWSKITKIPISQFNKSYQKASNHAFKKEGYKGCIKIQYGDISIFRKMHAVAKIFMERYK